MGVVVNLQNKSASRDSAPASIAALVDLVRADMDRVNALILSKAGSNVEMIPEIARHLIDSGGKRLRPMLTIAAAQMCGYQGDAHVQMAAAVEFMHTATLLHDDVVDESDMRRGKLAARKLWGNEASVLVGDYLLGQAFKMMVDVGSLDALGVLAHAATVIAEGEVLQLASARNIETTEDDYLTVIKAKTAALFSAATEIGPIISDQPKAVRDGFRSYGSNLGLAFQLIDDALDYGGKAEQLGKNIGDDFAEGKVTLPVVLAYRRGSDEERKFWQRAMKRDEIEQGDFDQALDLLNKYDTIADTVDRAKHFGQIARDALAPMPPTAHKDAMLAAVDFCIERVN